MNALNAAMVSVLVILVALILSMISKKAADTFDINQSGRGYVILFVCCQVYDIVACFFLLISQRVQRNAVRANAALEKSNLLWKQNERQYALSKENVELINRKCHDLRHQIAALSAEEGMSERRKQFIEEIRSMVDVYDSRMDTGNEALNTILMEKGLYCKVHNIQWTCVADGKILAFMDVVDLYTLMGNSLDNAIESVEKIADPEKRIISTSIWRRDDFGIIQIRNYFEGNIEIKDGLPVTSKGDTDNHGFGLRSMRKIVEKYQGTLSVKAEDNRFLLYIVVPLG